MKNQADCAPCLLKRVLFEARLAGNGREYDAVTAAVRRYCEVASPERCSAEVGTEVHRAAYASIGAEDPYRDIKIKADETAAGYVPEGKRFIDSSDDRLAAAVRLSIVGNIMDFGMGIAIDSPEEFGGVFRSLLGQGVGSDDTPALEEMVDGSRRILYAFDNCGEDQLDRLLIRELRSRGKEVVGVVRGAPIINDVTREDALRIGLDGEMDGLVDTGKFAVGFPLDGLGRELEGEMSRCDMLIAKGMANYESLTELGADIPRAHLLRAKCIPVAKSLGVPLNTNVVRVVR